MAIFTVGPNSTFPSIAAAMAAAGPGDTIQLETGYSNEAATVTHSGMIITGEASSTGIVLQLGSGIATVTLAGEAPFNLLDAPDGNGIVGNDGDNLITVTAGADAVSGGPGNDRLFVDYRLATGAVTGDSTSNFAEAGGGGRLATINGGFEDFTVWTGSGADTITTGAGDDDIRTGEGAGTVTAGEGANTIIGGSGADTITAGSGGNFVDGGDGTNTITTGGGADIILTGTGADTIVAGGGEDRTTVTGGSDTVDSGADSDLLIVDYSAAVTAVTGGVTGGNLLAGYSGHLADLAAATVDFVEAERFWITTGTGNDVLGTGDGDDRFTAGAGDDTIDGGGGNDIIDGGAGADSMTGGTGDDTYVVDAASDTVVEQSGEGADIVYAISDYVLTAGQRIETLSAYSIAWTSALNLTGNTADNILAGTFGDNVLNGGFGGLDVLNGFAGNDTYIVDADDVVFEAANEGNDIVYAVSDYVLTSGSHVETLSAYSIAWTSALNLTGNEVDNVIAGTAGANVIDGRQGNDYLVGFAGADTFAFTTALDAAANVDFIEGFSGITSDGDDILALDDAVFTGLAPGVLGANAFAAGTAAADADDRIIYDSATGRLYFDADGSGAGAQILFATLDGGAILTAGDFTVI